MGEFVKDAHSPVLNLKNQNLWRWGPASCTLACPEGGAGAISSVNTTALKQFYICQNGQNGEQRSGMAARRQKQPTPGEASFFPQVRGSPNLAAVAHSPPEL